MLTQHDKDIVKLQSLRSRLAVHSGLTAADWNLYDRLEATYDPESYENRKRANRLGWYKDHARQLTIEELEEIIAEKKARGEE